MQTQEIEKISKTEEQFIPSEDIFPHIDEECFHTPDKLDYVGGTTCGDEITKTFNCKCGKQVTERFTLSSVSVK